MNRLPWLKEKLKLGQQGHVPGENRGITTEKFDAVSEKATRLDIQATVECVSDANIVEKS